MNKKVRLGLNKLDAGQKVSFATNVGGALIANEATFPATPVAGADLMDFATSVNDAITAANAAKATWHELVSAQNDLVRTLEGYLRQTGNYVQQVSAGNAAIIELAGLAVRSAPEKVGRLNAPASLIATSSTNPGTVDLKWTPVKHAVSYRIQYAPTMDFPEASQRDLVLTPSKGMVTGLASATRYWFRVAAIGAAGPSLWTSAISVVTQ